jgi:hypothetical protein
MPGIKPPGTERTKGSKSSIYTYIRQDIRYMERDEWRAYFSNKLDELAADKLIWDWLNKERKYEGVYKNGEYQPKKKKGRPFDRNPNLPDTRNLNWDEI